MSDLAASGGYYIAMPADVIVAQPSTLTGSIGIFGGKFVTGRRLRKARREHRVDEHRPARRDELAGAALQRRTRSRKLEEQLRAFYDQFVEKVADVAPQHAGEDRSARAGARLDRAARRRRTAWSTSSAASRARLPSPRSARRLPPRATSKLVVFPPPRSFYELLSEQLSAPGARASRCRRGCRRICRRAERDVLRALRGPVRDVPARRAARADAVHVPALKRARESARCAQRADLTPAASAPRG